MASNNETVSRQNLWADNGADNIAKSIASEGNIRVTAHYYSRMLTDDRR